MREPRSHLRMKMRGLTEAATDAEIAQLMLTQRVLNYLRGSSDSSPIELPMPFETADVVTPEEFAAAAAHLAAHSAFAD